MIAAHVSLQSFRNYASLSIDVSEGFNVVHGPNAQGKTNFLEALFLLSSTRLLRGKKDSEAIYLGEDRAQAAIVLVNQSSMTVILQAGVKKRALLNGVSLPRPADLIGRLPSVCVSTADIPIVAGEPSERRLFLDFELSQIYPVYLHHLSHYKRALEQRNALLRSSETMPTAMLFEPWENQLAEHGAHLRQYRQGYIERLAEAAMVVQDALGSGEKLQVSYMPKDQALTETELLRTLANSRVSDFGRGSTGVGPHRDDVGLILENKEVRYFGSQGQQRTVMLALKLGSFSVLREEIGIAPMLLLDDIFSDLDQNRRANLVEWVLLHAAQTFLTCTEVSSAGISILERAKVLRADNGKLITE